MSTIAAIATPFGTGGISVIRISGKDALEIAAKIFISKSKGYLTQKEANTVTFGSIYNFDKKLIDNGMAAVFKAPNSFTGEDTVEISCHGGITVTRMVLDAILEAGADLAKAGEFTKRAFLNGKLNLTEAEGIIDLINAETKISAKAGIWQTEGRLGKGINSLRVRLVELSSSVFAYIDYPDEDLADITMDQIKTELTDVNQKVSELIKSYDSGRIIKEGVRAAIIGKTNAGKSSLMNLFSGYEKSIVTEIEGTTRDVIEEAVILGGIKVILTDTAGVRETTDIIEKIGVERSFKELEKADIVLFVFDNSRAFEKEDITLINKANDLKRIALINKSDLPNKLDMELINNNFKYIINISAKTGEGKEELYKLFEKLFAANELSIENGEVITNVRHLNCLKRSNEALKQALSSVEKGLTHDVILVDVGEAIGALGEITGAEVNEEIINDIFSRFCVGK